MLFPAWNALVARQGWLARGSILVASLPVLAGGALALAAFIPGDPHLDHMFGCHCATSMPGWLHLCPFHPTTAPGVILPAIVALLLLVPGRLAALSRLAREPVGEGHGALPTVVDLPRPVAVLVGWLRPSLVVDKRLWDQLTPDHREAVLAHERAHLQRWDPQVLAVLRLLTSVGPMAPARTLARRWLHHAERRADAAAAWHLADPLIVAEALVRCVRLAPQGREVALGWTAGGVEDRVRALLHLPPVEAPARPDLGLFDLGALALVCAAVLAALPWLHHQIEHLLNLSL